MTISQVANELQQIRNDRCDSVENLLRRCDTVGSWLSAQKNSKKVCQMLSECHELYAKIEGNKGYKSGKLQIQII